MDYTIKCPRCGAEAHPDDIRRAKIYGTMPWPCGSKYYSESTKIGDNWWVGPGFKESRECLQSQFDQLKEKTKRETDRANANEKQLLDICKVFDGMDARHVEGEGEKTIASMVKQEVDKLQSELNNPFHDLHRAWTYCVHTIEYDKKVWMQAERQVLAAQREEKKMAQKNEEKNIKTICSCGKIGKARIDNGLPAGVHCDECWNDLITDARKQSW